MTFSLLKMYFFTVPTQALHVILSVLAMKGKSPVHTPCPSPCLLPSLPPGCEGSQSSPWFRPPTRNVLERLCGTEFAEERQQAVFHVNSTGIFGGQRASRLCGQGEKAGPVLGRSGGLGDRGELVLGQRLPSPWGAPQYSTSSRYGHRPGSQRSSQICWQLTFSSDEVWTQHPSAFQRCWSLNRIKLLFRQLQGGNQAAAPHAFWES